MYARLRALRKDLSKEQGVPPYAIFSNDQLAEMVQRRVVTKTGLGEILGIGEARVEKYGEMFLEVLKEAALPALAPADEA